MSPKNEGTVFLILFLIIFSAAGVYITGLIKEEVTYSLNSDRIIKKNFCQTKEGTESLDKLIYRLN